MIRTKARPLLSPGMLSRDLGDRQLFRAALERARNDANREQYETRAGIRRSKKEG